MSAHDRRLTALLASAERMAGGEVEHRADISPAHDELDALAHALNVVVGELCYSAELLSRANEEAAAKERLAAVGQLAGGVAHEIRNPLAAILNATSVLRRSLAAERSPDVERSISIIQEEVRRANSIVTALLEYARHRTPERQPINVQEVVDRVLADAGIPTSVAVSREVERDVPLVNADGTQLHGAVANVVTNAIEAMPDGGNLLVVIAERDGAVVIAVVDDRATKPMDVGLDLLAAKTIAEAHGGTLVAVRCESGARFEIHLPLGTG